MWLAAVRDIAIVLLAVESLVIGALLVLMVWQLRKLVRLLQDEIAPLLRSANETVETVHGTVDFVSQNVVNPIIGTRSYVAGAVETMRNLFVIGRRSRPKSRG